MPDDSVTNAANETTGQYAASMWDRKKDNAVDRWLMPKKEIFQD